MKWIYPFLCLVGVALPYYFFVPFVRDHGLNLSLMVNELFANRISSFFAADVIVSSVVLVAFISNERRRRPVRRWWLCILAHLSVGVSLALPLFLLLREVETTRDRRDE